VFNTDLKFCMYFCVEISSFCDVISIHAFYVKSSFVSLITSSQGQAVIVDSSISFCLLACGCQTVRWIIVTFSRDFYCSVSCVINKRLASISSFPCHFASVELSRFFEL